MSKSVENSSQKTALYFYKTIVGVALLFCVFVIYRIKHQHSVYQLKKIPVETRLTILKRMYNDISTVANSLGVSVFLMYGTLLGCVRENDLICYDYDLDFGVHRVEYNCLLEGLKEYYGASTEFDVTVRSIICNQIVITHKETKLGADVFRLSSDDENIWRDVPSIYSTLILKECSHKIPIEWMYPLKAVTFLGKATYIPRDPAKVLSCIYGVDYETPNHTCNTDCTECSKK
jgi:hypothetical protein